MGQRQGYHEPWIQNSQIKEKGNSGGKGSKGTSRKATEESSETQEEKLGPTNQLKRDLEGP